MKYLTEIIYTAIICGILLRIGPNNSSKSRKIVKFVVSLAFLTVLSVPIINLTASFSDSSENFWEISDTSENISFDKNANISAIVKVICDTAAEKAAERFSTDKNDFSLKLSLKETESSDYSIEKVEISRKGSAKDADPRDVKEYFEEIFSGTKEVIIDDKNTG